MYEAKEGYCTSCESFAYFVMGEDGYECQNCKAINTMKGLQDIEQDPSEKADLVVDVNKPDDEII